MNHAKLVLVLALIAIPGCKQQPPAGRSPTSAQIPDAPELTLGLQRQIASRNVRDVERDIEDFTAQIDSGHVSAELFRARGDMWTLKREFGKAIDDYDAAIRLDTNYAPAWHNRGRVRRELAEFEEAMTDYTQAIQCNPDYAQAYSNRGLLFMLLNDLKRATADLKKAVDLNPIDEPALNGLARIYATSPQPEPGDGKKAVEFATKLCQLAGWTNAEYLESLAAAYAQNGEFENAVKWQLQALTEAADSANHEMRARLSAYKDGRPIRVGKDAR